MPRKDPSEGCGGLVRGYRDDILSWSFRTFEQAFRRQFVGKLHEDDIMEELRARYQGSKDKIAPFITKFRRIIAHLKRSPSLKEQGEVSIPPRRDKSGIPRTMYTGPHRSSHKLAAFGESSSGDEGSESDRRKDKKKEKKGRQKGTPEEVAAVNNPPEQFSGRTARNTTFQTPCQANNYTVGAKYTSSVEVKPQELISPLAPYSMPADNVPQVEEGSNFVCPCFVSQLVGHHASECTKRMCYACGQRGHFARDCTTRQTNKCQGCGKGGVTLTECPNCSHIVAALGNGAARTQ